MQIIIKDVTVDDLISQFAEQGLGSREARVLQRIAMRDRASQLPSVPPKNVTRASWDKLLGQVTIPDLQIVDKVTSKEDGFTKYVFRGKGPELFETVRIPLLHREGQEKYIACVSSQVGCNAGCAFCATGRMGFKRNLEVWEIVDQVVKVQDDSQHRLAGVVFMGMGEPMLNYARVMRAAKIMTDPSGLAIDGKAITISTVGVAPGIRRFTRLNPQYRLILSLSSAIPEKRAELLPMTKLYSLETLFQCLREHQAVAGRRVPLAWTLMSGVNLDLEEVKALAHWTKDLKVIINLIPVNDATGRFHRPEKEELDRFIEYLKEYVRQPIVFRYSGGRDIHGACGMLSAKTTSEATLV